MIDFDCQRIVSLLLLFCNDKMYGLFGLRGSERSRVDKNLLKISLFLANSTLLSSTTSSSFLNPNMPLGIVP